MRYRPSWTSLEDRHGGRFASSGAFGELKSAIGDKLKELANTIAVYQSGNRAGALELVRSDRGEAYMDRVREVISEHQAK